MMRKRFAGSEALAPPSLARLSVAGKDLCGLPLPGAHEEPDDILAQRPSGRLPCSHRLDAPHSRHWYFCLPCSHRLDPPDSRQRCFRLPCLQGGLGIVGAVCRSHM